MPVNEVPATPGFRLAPEYFQQTDTLGLAQDLVGKLLFTHFDGQLTGGRIVETEAYLGTTDHACHAHLGKRTKRTETMYQAGGVAYIYLCYGVHALLNLVTHQPGMPHVVLIRAIEPLVGLDVMQVRRGISRPTPRLTAGPGVLTQALGLTTAHNGMSLCSDTLWLATDGLPVAGSPDLVASPRVGIASYAGPDTDQPWRYRLRNNPWTSPAP
jgi:DNA-3-methyladenine glycosylase